MEHAGFSNTIAIAIGWAGVALVVVLCFFMSRSIGRSSLDYWTIAWTCLLGSRSALVVAFFFGSSPVAAYPAYLLGEYCFGYLLVAGCRNYSTDYRLSRRDLLLLLPATGLAVFLPRLFPRFHLFLLPHAVIMAGLFGFALLALRRRRMTGGRGPGLRLMSVALVLLVIGFIHYVPVLLYLAAADSIAPAEYLKYASMYDLALEIILGFAGVIVVMESASTQAEAANREILAAKHKLEAIVHLDPLTEALNRHAFYSLVDRATDLPEKRLRVTDSGCVVVIDIDNLKPLNDSFGHSAGDAAIRAVAKAIRSIIRPDDMLFRWGGDEFLVVLFNVHEHEVRRRVDGLNELLSQCLLPGQRKPVSIAVSYGLCVFSSPGTMERAIEQADDAMYRRKQSRKAMGKLRELTRKRI